MSEEKNGSDPIDQAIKVVGAFKTVMEIAEKSPELREAGTNVARVARTVTALVNNCLLPIAAVNFAFEKGKRYFEERFQNDINEIVGAIPEMDLVEPKASIAAPVLQGLTFSHEEKELREMYLRLLGSAMNASVASEAHPAFVEIIKQITSEEAVLLKVVMLGSAATPIVEVRTDGPAPGGYRILRRHILGLVLSSSSEPFVCENLPAMVDNFARLGLVTVTYAQHIADEGAYSWVEGRPEVNEIKSSNPSLELKYEKGILQPTAFGKSFSRIVL